MCFIHIPVSNLASCAILLSYLYEVSEIVKLYHTVANLWGLRQAYTSDKWDIHIFISLILK